MDQTSKDVASKFLPKIRSYKWFRWKKIKFQCTIFFPRKGILYIYTPLCQYFF